MSLSEQEPVEEQKILSQENLPEAEETSLKPSYKEHFEQFLSELDKLPDPESKLKQTIEFMEASISQIGTPHFKSFWEARNICLQLFKENLNPSVRLIYWNKYNELSKEARRLKDILDEQSAFAAEQIEIAVKALEDDIDHFAEHLNKMPSFDFGIACQSLANSLPDYYAWQRELNLLNTQAARINALRKELVRTEMRVRQKNKFFQRLSLAGDKVFPRRKELIKTVSDRFAADVDGFIKANFSGKDIHDSLFYLREEIKSFQNMAKLLTLNTHSFTHTRLCLSECWDQIKNLEKERKKERIQQKAIHKQNAEEVMQKIQEFKQENEESKLSIPEALKKIDAIAGFMRSVELGRDEIHALKDALAEIRRPVQEKIHAEEQDRQNQDQERERQRRHKIQEIKQHIDTLIRSCDIYQVEQIITERDAILESVKNAAISKMEKQEIERLLKPLRDIIAEKKETSLLTLSDDDRQALGQLKEVLKQRKERRVEIKSQIEAFRKASGSSGLDFTQAMNYDNQMTAEKERLEKINQGIREIELKIAELEK